MSTTPPRLFVWISACSPGLAESLALESDVDGLVIDNQHGQFDLGDSLKLAAHLVSKTHVAARVSESLGDAEACKFLDAGVPTLIAPMINTKAACEKFVRSCLYPPQGVRSFGPYRQKNLLKGGFSLAEANRVCEPLAMIETREALDNLDEILSVPGLRGVFVGPNDLAISLGHPPSSAPQPGPVLDAIKLIAQKTRARGLVAGIFCLDPSVARQMQSYGYNFISVGTDSNLLVAMARKQVAQSRL